MKKVVIIQYGVVYTITNQTNGKQYVGQTTLSIPKCRWDGHLASAKNGRSRPLPNAIRKYGAHNFVFKVVQYAASQKELDALEILMIATLDTVVPKGYNLKKGGSGGNQHELTKRKIAATHKLLNSDPEFKAKNVQRLLASVFAPEARARQRIGAKIAQARPEVKAKKSISVKIGMARPESKIKRSAVTREAMARPEVKAKHKAALEISNAKPEVKAARSVAMLEVHSRPEVKAKHKASCKAGHSYPAVKALHSKVMKEIRARPGDAEKRNSALKKTLAKPEVRAKKSAIMKAIRADPIKNAKYIAGSSTPEAKERHKLATKEALARPETKKKMSVSGKAWRALLTPEEKVRTGAKIRAKQIGKRWINNGVDNAWLLNNKPLPIGWVYGMLGRQSK